MSLSKAESQKSNQLELPLVYRDEIPKTRRSDKADEVNQDSERSGNDNRLMEAVVARDNVILALKRVRQNKGSPGLDGMCVEKLPNYLRGNWVGIRQQLLDGTYCPSPVKRQEIPKNGGGTRELGIPSVLDRFIQQAILQVLQPRFDPTFSEHSHGFRPGRRAHNAVREAQGYIQDGRMWVVDIDLEKFFDRVNHDVLMGRLAKRLMDKRMLRIIRRYLETGVMCDGVVMERHEGTPQGGPLSPLLANVLLDEIDKELERRGHTFVRYADDCNIYVQSYRAGQRLMAAMKRRYALLRLRVNETKSAVARATSRAFLGYSFWVAAGRIVKRRVANKALEKFKERTRDITRRCTGRSMEQVTEKLRDYIRGWKEYFHLSDTPKVFRKLDEWIRHRLRAVQLKHWRRGRTAFREFRKRGLSIHEAAFAARFTANWWSLSGSTLMNRVLPNEVFDALGVPRLASQ